MGLRGFVIGTAGCIVLAIVGYRMGTIGGLAVLGGSALAFGLVVQLTAWSIPTIGDVMDRAKEPGLGVGRDLRETDPDIRQGQHVSNLMGTPTDRSHPMPPSGA